MKEINAWQFDCDLQTYSDPSLCRNIESNCNAIEFVNLSFIENGFATTANFDFINNSIMTVNGWPLYPAYGLNNAKTGVVYTMPHIVSIYGPDHDSLLTTLFAIKWPQPVEDVTHILGVKRYTFKSVDIVSDRYRTMQRMTSKSHR